MKTKEQLEAELRPIQAALSKLRDEETLAESSALVGKCFKIRNCYSCPQQPSDYWWLYIKVVRVGEYWPVTFEFQTDKDGRIEIKTREARIVAKADRGYEQITAKEFNAAWRKVQQRVAKVKP